MPGLLTTAYLALRLWQLDFIPVVTPFDQIEDEPDWTNLMVMHAWGSGRSAGVYSSICGHYGVTPSD